MSGPSIPHPTVPPRWPAWASRPTVAANCADVHSPAGPDTEVPDELLARCVQCGANTGALAITPDMQTMLAGAVALGETVADNRAYMDGYVAGTRGEWLWGAVCGALGMALLLLSGMQLGYLWQVLP